MPTEPSPMGVSCPHCAQVVAYSPAMAGQVVACPKCQRPFQMPTGQTQVPVPKSPVQPQSAGSDAQALADIATSARSAFRSARRQHLRPATSWLDLFDWKFEKYLTPWIVRATWLACLVMVFVSVATILILTLLSWAPDLDTSDGSQTPGTDYRGSEFRVPKPPEWLASRISKTVAGILAICSAMLGLLWIRVVLEIVIVVFNIATTLTSIDEKLEASNTP